MVLKDDIEMEYDSDEGPKTGVAVDQHHSDYLLLTPPIFQFLRFQWKIRRLFFFFYNFKTYRINVQVRELKLTACLQEKQYLESHVLLWKCLSYTYLV